MAGRAPFIKDESGVVQRAYLLNGEDEWELAKNPFNRYSTIRNELGIQKLNPGYTFAKTILGTDKSISIGLVVNAKGGTSIKAWSAGSKFYMEALRRTKIARRTGVLKGILWHQGESDSGDPRYLDALKIIIGNIRMDLEQPDIPFVVGQLFYDTKTNPTTKLVNDQIAALPAVVPFSSCVSSEGLTALDNAHFDSRSMRLLGQRYAAQMLRIYSEKEAEQRNAPDKK